MASNYSINNGGSMSPSPFKKIKRFFKPSKSRTNPSSDRNGRKDSEDIIEQMTERSYYHVDSQRLHPPLPRRQDDNTSRQPMDQESHFEAGSMQCSLDNYSVQTYDVSQNPLYRPDEDVDVEKRYRGRSNEVYHKYTFRLITFSQNIKPSFK